MIISARHLLVEIVNMRIFTSRGNKKRSPKISAHLRTSRVLGHPPQLAFKHAGKRHPHPRITHACTCLPQRAFCAGAHLRTQPLPMHLEPCKLLLILINESTTPLLASASKLSTLTILSWVPDLHQCIRAKATSGARSSSRYARAPRSLYAAVRQSDVRSMILPTRLKDSLHVHFSVGFT
jgi:hypothetical protein